MEVIVIETESFFALVGEVVERLKQKEAIREKWVDPKEAMRLLHIKSATTLQNLRDTGQIRFSQPGKRIIAYDRDSIDAFWEKHARNTW